MMSSPSNTTFSATPAPDALSGIDLPDHFAPPALLGLAPVAGRIGRRGLGYAASIQSLPVYRTEVLLLIEETRPLYNTDIALPERTSTYLELINQGLMLEKWHKP
ncbi:MAG: hypothetical protein R3E79_05545 [Caldilineaceae bacterium]